MSFRQRQSPIQFLKSQSGHVRGEQAPSAAESVSDGAEIPTDADAFTLLQGVDQDCQSEIYGAGIYKFQQIAECDDERIRTLTQRHPSLKAVAWHRWRDYFQAEGTELTIPKDFENEPVQFSPSHGVFYKDPPQEPDQLDLIDGVTPAVERRLHQLGLYKFKQVRHLSDRHIENLGKQSKEFQNIEWRLWRDRLKTKGEATTTALARIQRSVPMEFAHLNHTYQDPKFGTIFKKPPLHSDRLSSIEGIDAAMESRLNRLGIFNYRQLVFLNDGHFANLRREHPTFRGFSQVITQWRAGRRGLGDHWRWGGRRSDCADAMEPHAAFGAVFPSRPSHTDQLHLLDGVDTELAAELNRLGIYRYTQLAQMTSANFQALTKHDARFRRLDPARCRFQASRLLGAARVRPAGRNRGAPGKDRARSDCRSDPTGTLDRASDLRHPTVKEATIG